MNRILVVDDQDDTLKEVSAMLTRKGLKVLEAQDTRSAANLFFESVSKILAVLIDIKLNDPTTADRAGYELACRLRGYNRFIPIFLYSAYPIDDDIKSDDRVSGWYQKGGDPSEKIDVEEIQEAGEAYWGDFHRDDPTDLVRIKNRLGIGEGDFLKLVEPRTPSRHDRLMDLILEVDANEIGSEGGRNPEDWNLVDLTRRIFQFTDGNNVDREFEARISLLEKENKEAKCMLTSLPFVFSYGENREAALKNFDRTLRDLFNVINGLSTNLDEKTATIDGADYLRLKSFFNRVSIK